MSRLRTFLLLLLGCTAASAQQPGGAPGAVPQPPTPASQLPGAVPAAPGGNPALPGAKPAAGAVNSLPQSNMPEINPNIPLGENKITEDIVEPKLSGNALAALYRRYTGRRVIVSSGAAAAEFAFVQEASPKEPLTFAQAAELLRRAAVIENLVFSQHPQDPNLDVLTLASGGIGPNNIDLDIYNENTPLPDTDIVITYVMPLSHIKPDTAVNVFSQIVGQFGSYGKISPVANASSVIITEKASLIRKLIELKKEIDKPSGMLSSRFVKVQYADVNEIAQTLSTLLSAQQSSQNTAGVQRISTQPAPIPGASPAANAVAQAAGGGTAGEENPPQIVPDPRTNRIYLMGRPVDIVFIEGLIREFDIPSTEKTFLRRKLRFLTVSEFLPIAGDALTRAFTGTGDGGAGATGGATGGAAQTGGRNQSTGATQSSSNRSSRSSGRSTGSFGGNNSFGGNSGFGGSSFGGGGSFGGGSMGGGNALDNPEVNSAPESLLVGRTLLVADNITNTVVAQGPPPALEIIERLLDQIDVKPDQIMISTVIGQLTLDDSHETGVSYLFNGSKYKVGGGAGLPAFLPSGTTTTPAGNSFPEVELGSLASSGLRAYGQFGDMGVFLKALQSKTDFTVLSRPSIFTSNNQKGTISSGERIAVPTQGGYNSGSYNGGTSIQYQDVVLKLEVIPLVNDNKTITMQIAMLNDEQNGTQKISGAGTNGGTLEVPRISTREILTTATVPNNKTIVLGGLIVNKDEEGKSGIPLLSDIPGLGRLFSSKTAIKNRSELMVFIQPSIVSSDRSMEDVQAAADRRYKVSSRVREFGEGPPAELPVTDQLPQVPTPAAPVEPPPAKPVESSKEVLPDTSGTKQPAAKKDSMMPVFRR